MTTIIYSSNHFITADLIIFNKFDLINFCNRIGGVMVSVLVPCAVDRGFESRSGQPETIKLVVVASPLSTQH